MTLADRFDRRLEAGLEEVALPSFPDYFDDILAVTSRTRQRPAWVFPERWLPMVDLARRPAASPGVPWRAVTIAAALVLAVALAAVSVVGRAAPGPRLPPPFGVAANGDLAVVSGGALRIGDRVVVQEGVRSAVFSPDGRSIAYLQTTGPSLNGDRLGPVVIDAATGDLVFRTADAGFGPDNVALTWSPDGSTIAVEHGTAQGNGNHASDVSILRLADGPDRIRPLQVGFDISEAAFRPGSDEILVRGWKDGRAGLFLMRPDGTDVRPVVIAADDLDDLGQPIWSPDGSRIAYIYGDRSVADGQEQARLHLTDPDGTDDTIPSDPIGVQDYWPSWSPDGTRIALSQFTYGGDAWVAIQPVAGGDRTSQPVRGSLSDDLPRVVWSPDGERAFVWLPDGHLQSLDLRTGQTAPLMINVDKPPSWQRLPLP